MGRNADRRLRTTFTAQAKAFQHPDGDGQQAADEQQRNDVANRIHAPDFKDA